MGLIANRLLPMVMMLCSYNFFFKGLVTNLSIPVALPLFIPTAKNGKWNNFKDVNYTW